MSSDGQINYNQQLRLEADRVLEDIVFQRAPVQRRLLKFLVDHTLLNSNPPTQYEIAVDGLGKGEDYDIEGDSYPRVQISRLRRSLENYYARNLPGDGFYLRIEQGSYRLELEAVTSGRDGQGGAPFRSYFILSQLQFALFRSKFLMPILVGVVSSLVTLAIVWAFMTD